MKRLVLWMLAMSLCAQSESFIFSVRSIKKGNASSVGPEWIIGLSDLHDKKHPDSKSQKKYIMDFLASLPKETVKVLTEDLSAPGSFGRGGCGRFYINSRGGVLGGITHDCLRSGFDAENHEYRYCRVSSFGPIINNLKADVTTLNSPNAIKIAALHDEIKKEMDHIRQYNDGPVLKKAYDHHLSHIQSMLTKLRLTAQHEMSVADYVKKHIPQEKLLNCMKALLTFDSELLDCKLAHAIKQERAKKYVVIIAGGAHVDRVCDLLLQDGYKKHVFHEAKDERTSDKNKCAGRTFVNNEYCIAPRAVDLSCLKTCCDI